MTTPIFDEDKPKRQPGLFSRLRASFLTGLVIVMPIGLTIWLIWTVVGWIDGFVLPLVPDQFQPDIFLRNWLGPYLRDWFGVDLTAVDDGQGLDSIRGVGVGVFLVFTTLVGWMAKGFIGRSLLRSAENFVESIPVVRSVYSGVKQIAETVFNQNDTSFEKACLIEYPRRGIWAIGFISTSTKGELAARDPAGEPMMSVFVPTTPNPTSGFLLFFPKSDIIELDMSVEDAAKLVISAGLVYPNGQKTEGPEAKALAEAAARSAAQ